MFDIQTVNVDDQTTIYFVHEEPTDQYINWFLTGNQAMDYVNFLKRGGAFNGWTPAFMLVETEVETDIDLEFETKLGELL